jgi:hypothetical protein
LLCFVAEKINVKRIMIANFVFLQAKVTDLDKMSHSGSLKASEIFAPDYYN